MNLATQVGQAFNLSVIEEDVRRLWNTGRFEDIRVERTQEAGGTGVVFQVVEAPELRLHAIRIEPPTFGPQLTLPEGAPLNRLRAHEIALEARKQLSAQGYMDARVDYDLAPWAGNKVDLQLTVRAGHRVRVKQIQFAGDRRLDPKELRRALRTLRIRRVLPRLPGLWNGLQLFPAYSGEAVDSELARVRSLYLSKGYFDASVGVSDVEIRGTDARIRVLVQSGRPYRVRRWTVTGSVSPSGGLVRARDFCSYLSAARREAERRGILNFSVKLDVQRIDNGSNPNPVAEVTAYIDRGQPYRAGRIEFTGNRHYKEATLRRNFLLQEGQLLDERLLRKSIDRLNRTMLFEQTNGHSIAIHPNEKTGVADVSVQLTERKRGAWRFSGPVGPMSFAGPLQASLSSRLPSWGSGLFELSTYTASASLFTFGRPLLPLVSFVPKRPLLLAAALERPFSPAEGWKSGFAVSPQMGWRTSALSYAATQIQRRLLPLLAGDRELAVTVESPAGGQVMFCEPPMPRFTLLRNAAALGLQLLGAGP